MSGESGALTEAHVYSRLRVKGCGEEVMAFVPQVSDTDVKTEADAQTVAEADDDTGAVVNVRESTTKAVPGSWCSVRLVSLRLVSVSLPEAVIELAEEGGPRRITVFVDDLRAVSKVKETPVKLHPSLQVGGKTMDAYNYEACAPSVAKAVAEHMLLWAHMSAQASVEHVTVSILADEPKLPFMSNGSCQCRF